MRAMILDLEFGGLDGLIWRAGTKVVHNVYDVHRLDEPRSLVSNAAYAIRVASLSTNKTSTLYLDCMYNPCLA